MTRVKDWRRLGECLLGLFSGATLDKIQRQHGSDEEACLKALIEAFLRWEGFYQHSWRNVIHALHRAGETHIAHDIMVYGEPVEGERLCFLPLEGAHDLPGSMKFTALCVHHQSIRYLTL